ncbi:MAG: nucleotidyltransferase domain-containing protein [Candidatus Falkowbacteria bacterium]|nr:nucleotidyltransferase domain-containing protein [Candidatus Falkowbacteria bacterium]
MLNNIGEILSNLVSFKPVSVVNTGSSASNEGGKESDRDIMVIFKDNDYVERSKLKDLCFNKVRIYPFRISEIRKMISPTPFPRKFYFWWISRNSKVLYGENVLRDLRIKITKKDLKEVIFFERGVALSAMHSFRNGDEKTARISFSKSCLFGTVAGIWLLNNKFISKYDDAVREGKKIFPKNYKLIKKANDLRKGNRKLTEQDVFNNIKYLHNISIKTK